MIFQFLIFLLALQAVLVHVLAIVSRLAQIVAIIGVRVVIIVNGYHEKCKNNLEAGCEIPD
jgi:hypothetical protein